MGQLLQRRDIRLSSGVLPSQYLPVSSVGGSMAPRWPIRQCLQPALCLSIWVENTPVWPIMVWQERTAQTPRCSQLLVRKLKHAFDSFRTCHVTITDQIVISAVFCIHRGHSASDHKQHSSNKLWKLHSHLWIHWGLWHDLLDEGQHAAQHEHVHSWSQHVLPLWKQHAALHSSDSVQWRRVSVCRHQSGCSTNKPTIQAYGELWVFQSRVINSALNCKINKINVACRKFLILKSCRTAV